MTGANGHAGPSTSVPEGPSQAPAHTLSGTEGQTSGRTPLSLVVTDAVKRWYMDTNKEAVKGDVVSFCSCSKVCSSVTLLWHMHQCSDAAEATSIAGANADRGVWL